MREFGYLVRVCTAREATNFGIFLNEVLGAVDRWKVRRTPSRPRRSRSIQAGAGGGGKEWGLGPGA